MDQPRDAARKLVDNLCSPLSTSKPGGDTSPVDKRDADDDRMGKSDGNRLSANESRGQLVLQRLRLVLPPMRKTPFGCSRGRRAHPTVSLGGVEHSTTVRLDEHRKGAAPITYNDWGQKQKSNVHGGSGPSGYISSMTRHRIN